MAILLGLRALYDFSLAQAFVTLGFIGLYAYTKFLEQKEHPDYVTMFSKELEEIKNKMSGLVLKQSTSKTAATEGKRFF
jgi:hypothetical protein